MVRMELNHIPQYHIYTFPAHLQGQNGMFLPAPEQTAELAEAQPFWTMPLAAAFLPCYFSSLKRLGRATFSWTAKYYSAPILATDPALLPLALKDNMTNTAVPAMPGLVCLANAGLLFLCFCFFFFKKTSSDTSLSTGTAHYFACLWKQYKTGLSLSRLAHLKQKQQQKTTHTF